MSELMMKVYDKKRYLLWLMSLGVAVGLFVSILSTAMVPGKYLCLLGGVILVVYAVLFIGQWKWSKVKFISAALLEIVLAVFCIVGISAVRQATQMVEDITEQGTESESISVYAMADSPFENIKDAADAIWGVVDNQSEKAVMQVIDDFSGQLNSDIKVVRYFDMFTAADALRVGEIQVLVLNDAFAGLISEIEGYEWFVTDVKLLDNYIVEVEVTESSKPTSQEEYKESIAQDTVESEEKNKLSSVEMELMGTPEYVDWNALVNQDMLVAPEGTFVAYISGADTWGNAGTKSRSDVNIIAVVNTVSKKVLLVSTPRDYYVPLSVSNGVKDKLTHAGIYGIDSSIETLELLYGVDIQYYVRVNFTGFVGIIDALGGVDVYSDTSFVVNDDFSYTQGLNHMSGIEALAFSRERYALAGGDRSRGNHQMEVIKAVLQKCASSSILYNYSEVMNNISGCFSTNMSQNTIASLVRMQLNDMAQWEITSMSVDGTGAKKTTYTMPGQNLYVMIPNEESVQAAKDSIAAVLK